MSFYRKYRPQVIKEIDNTLVQGRLFDLLKKEKKDLPHAYLFTGPKGTGKTTAARVIAKIFNCTKQSKTEGPCGKCDQCKAIAEGRSLDILEIDAASNRGIDEIRSLRERIALAPVASNYKVYIIDEVHMLTAEAFNALLKTLEEPPSHAVFVLATTEPHKVPATIKSRCVEVFFVQAKETELMSALNRIKRKEEINIDDEALRMVASYADGSFRDATKLLEQLSFHEGKITVEVVRQALSLSEEKKRELFLKSLVSGDAKATLKIVSEIVKGGRDMRSFLIDCLSELEQKLVREVQGEASELWTREKLATAMRKLTVAYSEMRASPIPHLPLELAVVEFCEEKETRDKGQVAREEKKEPVTALRTSVSAGLLSLEKLTEHWQDFIAATKPYNHSVAGVLRSSRPKAVEDGIVTIEAFYKFHQEKLSEAKTRETLGDILKKLFGEKVRVEIALGKK